LVDLILEGLTPFGGVEGFDRERLTTPLELEKDNTKVLFGNECNIHFSSIKLIK